MTTKKDNLKLKDFLERELGPFSFGNFMRGARASKDLSQVEMSDFLGISKSTLCDIEKGRQLVSPSLAARIARKCRLSIAVAVEASIQDQLRKAGLQFRVKLVA